MSTVQEATATPVVIEGVRGGPPVKTLRRDRWWVGPVIVVLGLSAFAAFSTWAALRGNNYYVGPSSGRDYLSPLYSPCIAQICQYKNDAIIGPWWTWSPAILVLAFPLGFRLTCYYYRRAYYRAFWWAPPACAVADARPRYTGETRFPLILQNVHRYFFYFALIFAGILTWDAIAAFRFPGGIGVGLGTVVLVINAVLIWLYTLGCHSCRHLCGGNLNSFSRAPIRHWLWRHLSILNGRHMFWAWASLIWVALTDLYIWLIAIGAFHDPRFI